MTGFDPNSLSYWTHNTRQEEAAETSEINAQNQHEKPCHRHSDAISWSRCHDCDRLFCYACSADHDFLFEDHFTTNFNEPLLDSTHVSLLQIRRQFLREILQHTVNRNLLRQLAAMSKIGRDVESELRTMGKLVRMFIRKNYTRLVTDFKSVVMLEIAALEWHLFEIRSLLGRSQCPDVGNEKRRNEACVTDMEEAIIAYKDVIQKS